MNSDNQLYNQWVENNYVNGSYCGHDDFYGDWKTVDNAIKREIGNDRSDEYRQPKDGDHFYQDPHTVAQNFIDRTQFPL